MTGAPIEPETPPPQANADAAPPRKRADPSRWSDAQILALRDEELSQRDVAERLGCSRARVRAAEVRREKGEAAVEPPGGAPPLLGDEWAPKRTHLADAMGVHPSCITRWANPRKQDPADPFPERVEGKGYHVPSVVAWRARNVEEGTRDTIGERRGLATPPFVPTGSAAAPAATGEKVEAAPATATVATQLKQERLREIQLKNDEREGKLIPREHHYEALEARARTVDAFLRALIDAAPTLAGQREAELRERLAAMVDGFRQRLAEAPLLVADDSRDGVGA